MLLDRTAVNARTYTEIHTINANNYSDWQKQFSSIGFKSPYGFPKDSIVKKIVPKTYKTFTIQVPNGMGPRASLSTKKITLPVSFEFTVHQHVRGVKNIWLGNHFVSVIVCTECGAELGTPLDFELPSK